MTSAELTPLIELLPYEEKLMVIRLILDKLDTPQQKADKPFDPLLLQLIKQANVEPWSPVECSLEDQLYITKMLIETPLQEWEKEAIRTGMDEDNIPTVYVV